MACLQLCILLIVPGLLLAQQDTTTFSGIVFGPVETFLKTDNNVYRMEDDKYVPGNVLFSDGHALKTTDGVTTYTLVGESMTSGYVNGAGTAARFWYITGFYQVNSTTVILADHDNHCLRIVNRVTNETATFAGQCQTKGNQDGANGIFQHPWSVINDETKPNRVLVTDENGLRAVDINTRIVYTVLTESLNYPMGVSFDDTSKILYLTNRHYISKYSTTDFSRSTVTGSSTTAGNRDGTLSQALFNWPRAVHSLPNGVLLVADESSNSMRIIDTNKNTVRSMCTGTEGNVDGNPLTCQLDSPLSMLLSGNYVYVGQDRAIRRIRVAGNGCPIDRLTIQLNAGQDQADVEILPGNFMSLAAGVHTFRIPQNNCVSVITVKAAASGSCPKNVIEVALAPGQQLARVPLEGLELFLPYGVFTVGIPKSACNATVRVTQNVPANLTCPAKMQVFATANTDIAVQTLKLGDIEHRISLPIGDYAYTFQSSFFKCDMTLQVVDAYLQSRLDIVAGYDVKCTQVSEEAVKTFMLNMAKQRYNEIDQICAGECNRSTSYDITLSCADDILTVTWPTSRVFDGKAFYVPSSVKEKINKKMSELKGSILDLVVYTLVPPIIYPKMNELGLPANVSTTHVCAGFRVFDATTQKCG